MQYPFQCIATVSPSSGDRSRNYFVVACGPQLASVCLETGEIVSEWNVVDVTDASSAPTSAVEDDERPAKKVKTASTASNATSNIIKLSVAPNHNFLLAVTEDKTIRVFSISDTGHLSELSSRCMPKRPCAVQVMPDNSTILCGDKFGDVYSLPMLPDPNWEAPKMDNDHDSINAEATQWKPSATDKTVHTKRNLKTLAAQQKQKPVAIKPKESLNFEHSLLLGHVSVLTDLTYASLTVDGRQRGYIVTADRDEHIRFSRRPPQSYVIEGYCLGHTDFVSKLCLLPDSELLVSGGGDTWLGLWHWPSFTLRRKISLDQVFSQPSAISLLKIFSTNSGDFLLVGCEASSSLGILPLSQLHSRGAADIEWSMAHLEHPILDMAFVGDTVIFSLDVRAGDSPRLSAYNLSNTASSSWQPVSNGTMDEKLQKTNAINVNTAEERDLDNLFYGIEKLRKRGHQDEAGDD